MLEEILKKETFTEADLKVIFEYMDQLTFEQKVRLGLEQPVRVETAPVVKKTTRATKKVV